MVSVGVTVLAVLLGLLLLVLLQPPPRRGYRGHPRPAQRMPRVPGGPAQGAPHGPPPTGRGGASERMP